MKPVTKNNYFLQDQGFFEASESASFPALPGNTDQPEAVSLKHHGISNLIVLIKTNVCSLFLQNYTVLPATRDLLMNR